MRHPWWSGLRRTVLATAFVVLAAWPATAQTQERGAEQQWRSLNAQVVEAYRTGDYTNGAKLAKEALDLARKAFGTRGKHTVTSLNNLGRLYAAQGRYGEAEPLYREVLQADREVHGPRHPDTLSGLNNLAMLYAGQGRRGEAEPLLREALKARRETLGPRHPDTLASLNNLAMLYQDQGHYGEAERLLREVLQAIRGVRGPRHPDTLRSLNNLADLYHAQARYGEAEPLLKEALQARREVLGPRHPDTLTSLNNLAALYKDQGRYGEAEPLYREALRARREVLGPRHPDTLTSLNNLATLYLDQGRYGEADPLYQEALKARRETLGPRHPDTLRSLHSLAELYKDQGRYGEAEPLYREALQATREVLGPRHPDTLTGLNNLATLYLDQGRYGEAEPLYREALKAGRETLGPRHPDTLAGLNNLALLSNFQGRYDEAERLLREALQTSREVLGPRHPKTLITQLNMVAPLVNLDRRADAVQTLQQIEPNLLGWVGQELYSTEAVAVRRRTVSSHANFQDAALSLATAADASSDARRLGATVMLRFKVLEGEEEAYLARLVRRSQDPRVQALADDIVKLRAALAASAQGAPDAFEKTLQALEAKRRELIDASPEYKNRLRVQDASFEGVRKALPAGAVLIEFRQFRPFDFRTGERGKPRFAALLLTGSGEPVVADLGPVSELQPLAGALGASAAGRGLAPDPQGKPLTPASEAAVKLYERLFAPFKDAITAAKTIYVGPDGFLNLVPFARLKLANGRYWFEQQEVRLVQTGRDLLRPEADHPARGLLALGGIDFDAGAVGKDAGATGTGPQDSVFFAAAGSDRKAAVSRAADSFRGGFPSLPATASEVKQVMASYKKRYADEPAEIWSDANATKARLMALKSPPRVLHLATHGFYLPNQSREPMLLSGIALAGANREVAGAGNDGLLFALEAEGLNLDGTELVVLSACDTAQGNIDYSEGVFGLARALRTAGARYVLVTLWKLDDFLAGNFMADFYKTWSGQEHGDPAKALRDTQLQWIRQESKRNPRDWAPYVLIE